uniref:Uncharacterized protein n=1 Tax=Rhizoctonia solani TaxID=456999 RepID=N0ACQ0_9AGAM|nr:hypothetical protein RSOL_m00150 [Rhizoctonia solani]AGK45357.1 hypothetical protein RSOL_m00150 [Rhizoctonia solani]
MMGLVPSVDEWDSLHHLLVEQVPPLTSPNRLTRKSLFSFKIIPRRRIPWMRTITLNNFYTKKKIFEKLRKINSESTIR